MGIKQLTEENLCSPEAYRNEQTPIKHVRCYKCSAERKQGTVRRERRGKYSGKSSLSGGARGSKALRQECVGWFLRNRVKVVVGGVE